MTLKKIHLTLARDHDFPEGSQAHGYEFVAPLTEDGHLDAAVWRAERRACWVRRFWAGEDDELGHLVHTKGRKWAFHYDIKGDEDEDEPGFRFDSHLFRPGEYVSIREQDGKTRTFRVQDVSPVRAESAPHPRKTAARH